MQAAGAGRAQSRGRTRLPGAVFIAAIRALSTLSADEVGLHLQLVSYAPITGSELSEFCVASDPVSAFVNRIRKDDGDSSSIAGFLAGG